MEAGVWFLLMSLKTRPSSVVYQALSRNFSSCQYITDRADREKIVNPREKV